MLQDLAFGKLDNHLLDPVDQFGTVVKATEGLKALTETDHGGSTELHDSLDNTHGGNDHIAIGAGHIIETNGGDGSDALPGQGGQTTLQDHLEMEQIQADILDVDGNIATLGATCQQQADNQNKSMCFHSVILPSSENPYPRPKVLPLQTIAGGLGWSARDGHFGNRPYTLRRQDAPRR